MKLARKQLDKDYKELVRLLYALLIVESPGNYSGLVNELYQHIGKFNKIIASGRAQ